MNLLKKIRFKCKDILSYVNIYNFKLYIKIRKQIKIDKKKVFLIGTPWHGNIGDQALVLAEKYLLKKVFNNNEYELIEIPSMIYNGYFVKIFGLKIEKDDFIFLQGGGNLGTLYLNEEYFHREVVKNFPDNKIIIMPMSIYFHDSEYGKEELNKSSIIYNRHKYLTILERDKISYDFAKKYFNKVNNILVPDSVTSLENIIEFKNFKRDGICFFLRNDIEKIVEDKNIDDIKKFLEINKIKYIVSDTFNKNEYKNDFSRREIVTEKWNLAQSSRLVITDRYHGVIFAVITHTPVIVFKSFDTKISSGVKWFKDLEWVYYVDSKNLDSVFKIIDKYCLHDEYKIKTTSECKNIIINKLKDIVSKIQ